MAINTNTSVVVLGGTSGIGLATAKASAATGTCMVAVSRNPTKVQSALAELTTGSEGFTVDASSGRELATFFEHVGEIDHLACTARDNLVPITLDVYTPEQGPRVPGIAGGPCSRSRPARGAAYAGGWVGDSNQRNRGVPRRRRLVPRLGGRGGADDVSAAVIRRRDADLLRAFHDEHAQALWPYVLGLTNGDRSRAQDVVQDTMLRAWQDPAVVEQVGGSGRGWLFTVAKRIVIDQWRLANRRPEVVTDRVPDQRWRIRHSRSWIGS